MLIQAQSLEKHSLAVLCLFLPSLPSPFLMHKGMPQLEDSLYTSSFSLSSSLNGWMHYGFSWYKNRDIWLQSQGSNRALVTAPARQQSALFSSLRSFVTKYSVAGFLQVSEDHWFPSHCSRSCRRLCRSVQSWDTWMLPCTRELWTLSLNYTICFGSANKNCKGWSRYRRQNCKGHITTTANGCCTWGSLCFLSLLHPSYPLYYIHST